MSDFSSIDPTQMATQLAQYDILAMQNALKSQSSTLAAQRTGLSSLRTALTTFRTAITGMNSSSSTVLKNIASMNQEGIANITASASARKGTYSLNVTQLATAEQTGYSDLTDQSIKDAKGTLSITVDGKSIDINMDDLESLSDFADAVNKSAFPEGSDGEKTGVTASLVRTDGKVTLMLSSDQTGAKNSIQLDTSGLTSDQTIFDNTDNISDAQDAKFTLGNSQNELTSSSNTLSDLVDGVSIQLTGTTEANKPLIITVDTDTSGTQEQVQAFIDAYNTLKDTLKSLTASGSDGKDRGAFAGDASMSSLSSELSNMLRNTFGDQDMTKFGITADKDGKLTLDSDKLNEQLKNDPQSVTDFFNGDKGLLKTMDKSLDKYLSSTSGLLKGREDTLDRQQKDIDDKTAKIQTRYDNSYNRYLKQFTQLQQVMTQMNNTMSMFGLV
ncbi:flagellar filament capping protein FliD [Enterobacter sp. CC120223-11]|uniref:flagellar filament capping protein FliD n=1 Tax=Enterobacter sp. CC120223-11 TaxID=1378073 RepID=UPI000BDC828D|nr:flagellar filament capping protein FliD [Enterobacter sp. CC120223-11]SNY67968.1 flagellar hook-associated protein 2 [Enterobacter sp. CC120223-11]